MSQRRLLQFAAVEQYYISHESRRCGYDFYVHYYSYYFAKAKVYLLCYLLSW